MYKVQIEIEIYFTPPMKENEPGVALLKDIELPFPPVPEIGLVGPSLDANPFPPGFIIKELSYDLDRSIFLAKSANMIYGDFSLAEISCELQRWSELGWSRGTIQDYYEQEYEDEGPAPDKTEAEVLRDFPRVELPAKVKGSGERAQEFHDCLRGMTRLLVESNNQVAIAYAIDKTGLFVTKRNKDSLSPREIRLWDNAIEEYDTLTMRKQERWKRKVMRYPGLDEIDVEPWNDDED